MPWIAHVDMDSFFVAVERQRDPRLNGRPVVVGGKGPRAVVASASYEARAFGVRSAQPMAQARQLCPNLIIVEPRISEYSKVSEIVFAEMEKVTPLVEQVSIDEAYLDLTGCEKLYHTRELAAALIKERVKTISGLTCTVALAENKLLAKVGSDFAKPDGIKIIPSGSEASFLAPLSIRKIPGVGPKTAALLELRGIKTCADLANASPVRLRSFGFVSPELQQFARGIDTRVVEVGRERKSLGAEQTFSRDVGDLEELCRLLRDMADQLSSDLRTERLKARTVQIKIRYPDFSTYTRAHTLPQGTQSSNEIATCACTLLRSHKQADQPLRLLGLSVRNFEPEAEMQISLFDQSDAKQGKLDRLKDELKARFGTDVLVQRSELK